MKPQRQIASAPAFPAGSRLHVGCGKKRIAAR